MRQRRRITEYLCHISIKFDLNICNYDNEPALPFTIILEPFTLFNELFLTIVTYYAPTKQILQIKPPLGLSSGQVVSGAPSPGL